MARTRQAFDWLTPPNGCEIPANTNGVRVSALAPVLETARNEARKQTRRRKAPFQWSLIKWTTIESMDDGHFASYTQAAEGGEFRRTRRRRSERPCDSELTVDTYAVSERPEIHFFENSFQNSKIVCSLTQKSDLVSLDDALEAASWRIRVVWRPACHRGTTRFS
jgi:hypothetical protein